MKFVFVCGFLAMLQAVEAKKDMQKVVIACSRVFTFVLFWRENKSSIWRKFRVKHLDGEKFLHT